MAAYLRYAEVLKKAFLAFELVHVPREKNARADRLAKLASSGKGGRQRTVIQETLKTPRKFVTDNMVDVLHVSTTRGKTKESSIFESRYGEVTLHQYSCDLARRRKGNTSVCFRGR